MDYSIFVPNAFGSLTEVLLPADWNGEVIQGSIRCRVIMDVDFDEDEYPSAEG